VQVGARRRWIADVVLRVVVGRPSVDLVPREVGVAEDDKVGVGEAPLQPGRASGCGAAVVHQCDGAAGEREREPVGQLEPLVGVPRDGVNFGVRCAVAQGLKYRMVADVAGVEHCVRSCQVSGDSGS
jgi:hypothetical protein